MVKCSILRMSSSSLALSACGEDESCSELCREVRPKLLDQMPNVSPDDVNCSEAPWTEQKTCEDCIQLFEDLYAVSVTASDELCLKHFGSR